MKKVRNFHSIFAAISAFVLFVFCGGLFALGMSASDSPSDYRAYPYYEHVDASSTMDFHEEEGAQLYEAESGDLSGNARIVNQIGPSGDDYVELASAGDSLSFSIDSSFAGKALLSLSVYHVSQVEQSELLSRLLKIELNSDLLQTACEVPHSYNEFFYHRIDLGVVALKKGINHIDLIWSSSLVRIDYLALTPKAQRTGHKPIIGYDAAPFRKNGRSQIYELERGEKEGCYLSREEGSSGDVAVIFASETDSLTYCIRSDGNKEVTLELRGKTMGEEKASCLYSFRNEGGEIVLSGNEYNFVSIGSFVLEEGDNVFAFKGGQKAFSLDCIRLNGDCIYSGVSKTQSLFPEQATYSEEVQLENYDVNHTCLAFIENGSTINFSFRSPCNDSPNLALQVSYWGDPVALSYAFSVLVNSKEIALPNLSLQKRDGFYDFYYIPLGVVDIVEGDNVVSIAAKSSFNLASIAFYRGDQESLALIEAEDMGYRLCQEEVNKTASNYRNIGYFGAGAELTLLFSSAEDCECSLVLACSLNGDKFIKASEALSIKANGESVDLASGFIRPTYSWIVFDENEIGTVSIKQGFNVLKVESLGSGINPDYISLQMKSSK